MEFFKDGVRLASGSAINLNESTGIDIVATSDGHEGDFTISVEAAATEAVTTSAPALAVSGSSTIDSTANAVDATLAAGQYIGQIKTIVMTEASNSSTVSIANHQTADPEVATFNAVDETGVFMWTGTEWVTIFATCTFV